MHKSTPIQRSRSLLAVLAAGTLLSACTLAPTYQRPALPVDQAWPVAAATTAETADLGWRDMFPDERLRQLIDLALRNNRDLRVAVANIEKARAQYGVQRASSLPSLDASASEVKARTPASVSGLGRAVTTDQYSASVGFTAFELDLFGRVRSLNQAALQSYLATQEDRQTVQISLIGQVVNYDLQLAADLTLLKISQDALTTRDESLKLTRRRFDSGAASQLDVSQSETLAEQARSDVAAAIARVANDRNALRLVVGADVPAELEPTGGVGSIAIRRDIPVGLPAEVLVRRPDVLSAEHALKAQNADIGAARAAFFPRITLTGDAGSESTELSRLFSSGSGSWSFTPQISVPLFHGGANIANLNAARASRDIAVAQYEKAVETAFREVADQLAVRATINDQLQAQQRQVASATVSLKLSQARYDRGLDSYLPLLDAQRTLYSAQQTLVATELAEATNRVGLFTALGGGKM